MDFPGGFFAPMIFGKMRVMNLDNIFNEFSLIVVKADFFQLYSQSKSNSEKLGQIASKFRVAFWHGNHSCPGS